ncbi:MAG: hypothetical protein WCG26_00240 [Chloroflexales bacterium]
MSNETTIIATMERLAARGWCVVLKRLPPNIGWLVQGSRSEYDAPCPDNRVNPNTWLCEASFIGQSNRWMFEQVAFGVEPLACVEQVETACAAEERRTQR